MFYTGRNARGGAIKMKRGYEYEMMLARIDKRNAAIHISNISLASSSGFYSEHGIGVCGLDICAIRLKKEIKSGHSEMEITRHTLH
jgi:hypothetical protein